LFVTLHFKVLFSPFTTEAGSAVRVITGAFLPVVPPMPTATPPPGRDAELFSVPVSWGVLMSSPCFLLNSALLLCTVNTANVIMLTIMTVDTIAIMIFVPLVLK
jgi:hypothetical protein